MSNVEGKPFRVMMWCVPRSISTAVCKCFSFIDNTEVWFEPYCGLFMSARALGAAGISFPQKETDIDAFLTKMDAMDKGSGMGTTFDPKQIDKTFLLYRTIQESLNSVPVDKNVFVKDMAFCITDHYSDLPRKEAGFRHTFLIRNPERVFPSWRNLLLSTEQVFARPGHMAHLQETTFDVIEDTPYTMPGYTYKCQYDLWRYVRENYDNDPIVIDVDEMLANPGELLPKYFKAAGMPWDEGYLRWDPSAEGALDWRWMFKMDLDQEWIAKIHKTALTSSQFRPSKPVIPRSKMTPDVIRAVDATMGYYKEMAESRITI